MVASTPGCGSDTAGTQTDESAVNELAEMQAKVVKVELSPWPLIVQTQGNLAADEQAVTGARVAGRIQEVHVDLGDRVSAGDPLATLDDELFRFDVTQAESQLQQTLAAVGLRPDDDISQLKPENAPPVRQQRAMWDESKANLKRARELRQNNVITVAELEQLMAAERVAEARYASALNSVREKIALIGVRSAELARARQRLNDAIIRAPFDGLVQARHVAPGDYAEIGDPTVTIVRTNPLRFRGSLPERYVPLLRPGQQIRLEIESVAEPHFAEVTRISPTLDQRSRTLLFEAIVQNPDNELQSGVFAEGEVVLDLNQQALVVPASAVAEFAGTQKVWKVVEGAAAEQLVLTGQRRAGGIEILEGLEPGDLVLWDGSQGQVARVKYETPQTMAPLLASRLPFADAPTAATADDSDQSASQSAE